MLDELNEEIKKAIAGIVILMIISLRINRWMSWGFI